MKKFALLPLAAATAMVFNGCALVKTTHVDKINDIEHKETAQIRAYGGERATVLGPAFFKQDGPCSEVDFLKFVNGKYPESQDVIRVRLEHHKETKGEKVTEYCKYSGIAVVYKDISVEETAKWKALYEGTNLTTTTTVSTGVQFAPVTANVQFVPANVETVPAAQPAVVEAPVEENTGALNFITR